MARRERRWTLRRLAERAVLSVAAVHAIESGRIASIESYVRVATALGLRAEFELRDPRRRTRVGSQDLVHSAMGELQASVLQRHGFTVRLDEPYQHFQFAGRADLVAWTEDRRFLHVENRTRFPDFQDAIGRFTAKRAYLADDMARRLGIRGGWRSETHVIAALWSAEVIRDLRRREASLRAVCPDPTDAFAAWWSGTPSVVGHHTAFVLLDPIARGRSDRRSFVGIEALATARPRYTRYREVVEALERDAVSRRERAAASRRER